MKKYHIGLFIGRFQPFHKGHLFVLKKALEDVEKIIIGIGSANKSDSDNPLSAIDRKEVLNKIIQEENLEDRIVKIELLDDNVSDDLWLSETLEKVGKIDVVIGNNDWVNNLFKKIGIPALLTEFFYRDALEGQYIRKLIRQNRKWEHLVPENLSTLLLKKLNP
jgi:nicotinamide-nucleotide adenylyltransferase